MITGADVLHFLIPQGGWVIYGNNYENIQFNECESISKEQFENGFAKVEEARAKENEIRLAKKAAAEAKLAALGITADDLKVLGLG